MNPPPTTSGGEVTNKIDPELKQKIDSAPTRCTWDIKVVFKSVGDPIWDPYYKNLTAEDERYIERARAIEKYAIETQKKVQVLDGIRKFKATWRSGTDIKAKPLGNNIYIDSAPKELIYQLGDCEKPENENITGIFEDKEEWDEYGLDD